MNDKPEECTCHISQPCDFCMSMTEEEADVYWKEGLKAVLDLRRENELKQSTKDQP